MINPVYADLTGGVQLPYDRAREVYQKEECARTFDVDLYWHLVRGYVHCSPRAFAMARPVQSSADYSVIVRPDYVFRVVDCWHVYLVAGDWIESLAHLPFELPMFSWERNNKLRFYRRECVIRHANRAINLLSQGRREATTSAVPAISNQRSRECDGRLYGETTEEGCWIQRHDFESVGP